MKPSSTAIDSIMVGSIVTVALAGVLCTSTAPGLIRPDFTPVHLAQQSTSIASVTLAAPNDGVVTFAPGAVLKGSAPASGMFVISGLSEVEQKAFVPGAAVLWLTGDYAGLQDPPMAMLYLGEERWFGVYKSDAEFVLKPDRNNFNAVWAGGSDMLTRALAWILADTKADVPVNPGASWSSERKLGTVSPDVSASAVLDIPGIGPCVYFAARGGDRLIRSGPDSDATTAAGISGGSRAVCAGDVDGDGKLDLVRWDGQRLSWRGFSPQAKDIPIAGAPADIHGLACIDAGVAPRSAIVAFGSGASTLLVPDAAGGFSARQLPAPPAAMGTSSAGLAADLDGDGCVDVAQAFATAVVIWRGTGKGSFAEPSISPGSFLGIHTILPMDADGDGRLDLVVAGSAKEHHLLINQGHLRFVDRMQDTGELVYHAPQEGSVAAATWDVNRDGRSDLLLFAGNQGPKTFFNRGFACFGYGRELHIEGQTDKPGAALTGGSLGGGSIDVDGDGQPDLVAVDKTGAIWGMLAKPDEPGRLTVTVALPAGQPGPVTVVVEDGGVLYGARHVASGSPAVIGKLRKGPLTVTWKSADGTRHSTRVVVVTSMRIALAE